MITPSITMSRPVMSSDTLATFLVCMIKFFFLNSTNKGWNYFSRFNFLVDSNLSKGLGFHLFFDSLNWIVSFKLKTFSILDTSLSQCRLPRLYLGVTKFSVGQIFEGISIFVALIEKLQQSNFLFALSMQKLKSEIILQSSIYLEGTSGVSTQALTIRPRQPLDVSNVVEPQVLSAAILCGFFEK